jgi:hypothetical protein
MEGATPPPRKRSHRLSEEDAVTIWHRHWEGELNSRIAATLDVNQGRISEVLTRQRFPGSENEARRRLID